MYPEKGYSVVSPVTLLHFVFVFMLAINNMARGAPEFLFLFWKASTTKVTMLLFLEMHYKCNRREVFLLPHCKTFVLQVNNIKGSIEPNCPDYFTSP